MLLCKRREIFGSTEGVGNTWGEAVLLLAQALPSSRPGQASWSPQSQGEPGAQAAATQASRRQSVLSSLMLPGLTTQTPKTPCMCLGASAHAKLQVAKGQGCTGRREQRGQQGACSAARSGMEMRLRKHSTGIQCSHLERLNIFICPLFVVSVLWGTQNITIRSLLL